MNASELRLGNWVLHDGKPMKAKILMAGKCSYEPLPLTAEILEKAGFEKATDQKYGGLLSVEDKHGQRLRIREWEHGFCYTLNSMSVPIDLQFLHQLQNLYFALTGEELNIEL